MSRTIASKRHELVIFRGNDRVWEGPIFRISDEGSQITIVAKDVTAYLFGTALSRIWDNSTAGDGPTEVTTRFRIRYLAGVKAAMRISFASRTFDIQSVINPDERNRELHLMAVEVIG